MLFYSPQLPRVIIWPTMDRSNKSACLSLTSLSLTRCFDQLNRREQDVVFFCVNSKVCCVWKSQKISSLWNTQTSLSGTNNYVREIRHFLYSHVWCEHYIRRYLTGFIPPLGFWCMMCTGVPNKVDNEYIRTYQPFMKCKHVTPLSLKLILIPSVCVKKILFLKWKWKLFLKLKLF